MTNYLFTEKAKSHLIKCEGFKDGFIGVHNYDSFIYLTKDLRLVKIIEVVKGNIEGVYEIYYKVSMLNQNKQIIFGQWRNKVFIKTVYDPQFISDEDIEKWAREALENVRGFTRNNELAVQGTAKNGQKFQGWININTNEFISYYPVINFER